MINDTLYLLKTWYTDTNGHGIANKLALVPRLPSDSAAVGVEVHSEIDLTDQGNDLAVMRVPVPQVVAGVGNVLVGLALARPGFNLDPKLIPLVRDDEIPILHLFGRRVTDAARGTRDLGYVFQATLASQRELCHPDYEANRKNSNIGLVAPVSMTTLPTYQATEDIQLLLAFVTVWQVRTFKPTGL